jgi:Fe-Mn family superoxide dismutase
MHTLPKLPYEYNALEPWIDAKTMEIHHTKHHQAYIDKLNAALEKYPELQNKTAEELIKDLKSIPADIQTQVRNHGGGHVNHSFFWQIMCAGKENNLPEGEILELINQTFQNFDKFKEQFANAGLNRFGSGWAWLIINKQGNLEITNTANQDSPLSEGKIPLLGVDVWEHAYYLKYQNKRADYINAFFNVINWEKVEEFYEQVINR